MPTANLACRRVEGRSSVVMSALSELIQAANADDWSVDRMYARARELDLQVSRDAIWRYSSGRNRTVDEMVLRAFAAIFPALRIDDLMRAAQIPPRLGNWSPPKEANLLDEDERAALNTIIKSMAAGKSSVDLAAGSGKTEAALRIAADTRPEAASASRRSRKKS